MQLIFILKRNTYQKYCNYDKAALFLLKLNQIICNNSPLNVNIYGYSSSAFKWFANHSKDI
jgi:hypothetical protein